MRFENTEGNKIYADEKVSVKKMNHIVEVKKLLHDTTGGLENVQKLNKYEYILTDTGEVKTYNLSENRGQNIAGLKDTFRKIRDLINNNFTGKGNELHVTLTYKENMTDTKQLYKDFDKFWKRYTYRYGKDIDYLTVVEPQGRGAWHCHLLIRHNDTEKIYIPSKDLAEIWGKGFIKIKALEGVDNIGAYLSAYLGDVELTPENLREVRASGGTEVNLEVKEVKIDGENKAFIKGGRCYLYPPGMNLYRHSKGIKFPEVQEMEYRDIKKIVGSATPNYSRTVNIYDEQSNRLLNSITYEQYNTVRKKTE